MHPTKPELTQADFDAWPNCSVPDCEYKVTHDSDKCFPHARGWEAVRANIRERLAKAEEDYKRRKTEELRTEIKWCRSELTRLAGRI